MRSMLMVAFCAALLSIPPGVWAGGMGGSHMGGMGGGMIGGDQWGMRPSWSKDRYAREDRRQRQYEEDTRRLRRAIDEKQDAIDHELDRTDPDLTKVKQLHRELKELRNELNDEQSRFEQSRRENARQYDGGSRYPSFW